MRKLRAILKREWEIIKGYHRELYQAQHGLPPKLPTVGYLINGDTLVAPQAWKPIFNEMFRQSFGKRSLGGIDVIFSTALA